MLLLVDRRFRIRPPGLFCLYVAWYTFGRFFEELLRIDPSHEYLGLRLNAYVSIVVFVLAIVGFVWSQRREEPLGPPAARRRRAAGQEDGHPQGPHPKRALASAGMALAVRELPLDLDAFEGPFDLLLTLVLKEELDLADVDIAEIVLAFVERLEERGDARPRGVRGVPGARRRPARAEGARALPRRGRSTSTTSTRTRRPDELAERLALYRRFKAAAAWLEERLAAEGDRFFRIGPAPLAPAPARPAGARKIPSSSWPPSALSPSSRRSRRFATWRSPIRRCPASSSASGRCFALAAASPSTARSIAFSRIEQIVAFIALFELRKREEVRIGQAGPFEPITVWNAHSS